jgi:NADH dehydrogenase [ubiquinone] 1 alpha subcomplex assembly factor 7
LHQLPEKRGVPTFAVGQEFLDAFPVHQFVYTKKGWREKLVDIDMSSESPYHFRAVLSPNVTPATKVILGGEGFDRRGRSRSMQPAPGDLVRGVASAKETVTQTNSVDDKSATSNPLNLPPKSLQEGDSIEICPLALAICEDIAHRVTRVGGVALFIDYGENFTQGDSLRAFKKHQQVNIFTEPGTCDMTGDVDFSACSRSALTKGAKGTVEDEFL